MVVYFVGDSGAVRAARRQGFTDSLRMVRDPRTGLRWSESGVWLSDRPAPDEHQHFADRARVDALPLAVPDGRLDEFEVAGGGWRRRWFVPAAVANQFLPAGVA